MLKSSNVMIRNPKDLEEWAITMLRIGSIIYLIQSHTKFFDIHP